MFRFHQTYFLLTVLLFITEGLIAVYVNDRFIRPYFGDFLVVVLLYCFVRSFFAMPVFMVLLGVLVFSFCIEIAQYFQLVKHLHLEDNKLAKTVIGSSFEWIDLLAYTLGILFTWLVEKYFQRKTVYSL